MVHADAGRSLPVPNVQALAQTYNGGSSNEQIPERYIRVEENAEEVIGGRDISSAIPIIDLNKLLDPLSSKEERAKLGSACNQWGFFQVYVNLARESGILYSLELVQFGERSMSVTSKLTPLRDSSFNEQK